MQSFSNEFWVFFDKISLLFLSLRELKESTVICFELFHLKKLQPVFFFGNKRVWGLLGLAIQYTL